jgi:hypothetical protein
MRLSQKILSQKIGLVEWLKVKALSSNPSTTKKKKRKKIRIVDSWGECKVEGFRNNRRLHSRPRF